MCELYLRPPPTTNLHRRYPFYVSPPSTSYCLICVYAHLVDEAVNVSIHRNVSLSPCHIPIRIKFDVMILLNKCVTSIQVGDDCNVQRACGTRVYSALRAEREGQGAKIKISQGYSVSVCCRCEPASKALQPVELTLERAVVWTVFAVADVVRTKGIEIGRLPALLRNGLDGVVGQSEAHALRGCLITLQTHEPVR